MAETPENGGFAERTIQLLRRQVIILKAMSFALIGLINSLVDFAVFLLTLRYVTEPLPGERLDLIVANVLAWMVAVSGSYVMNSYVTFAAESGRKLRWKSFLAFVGRGHSRPHRQHRDARDRGRLHAGRGGENPRDRRRLPDQFLDVAFRGVPAEEAAARQLEPLLYHRHPEVRVSAVSEPRRATARYRCSGRPSFEARFARTSG